MSGPIHGTGPHFRRVRVRLVMCERGRDAMVEAVVQFGDDQDDETLNSVPHHVLPTMANAVRIFKMHAPLVRLFFWFH